MLRKVLFCMFYIILASGYGQVDNVLFAGARAVPKLLNYQGYLTDTLGSPIDDSLDMTFKIFDAATMGNELWSESQLNVPVERGVFSVLLGSGTPIPDTVFTTGTDRWLELTLEGPETLSPRTRITAMGYAYTSTYSDTAEYAKAGPGVVDNDWLRGGPSDTVLFTANYLGIARGGADNVLYGDSVHTHINLGVACTTGTPGQNHHYCTVAGGYRNTASDNYVTVAGGWKNKVTSWAATIAGGQENKVSQSYSIIGGGALNTITSPHSVICGGYSNTASGTGTCFVGGGAWNTAIGERSVVCGGMYNVVDGDYSTVSGGEADTVSAQYGTISGGRENKVTGTYGTIGGGWLNQCLTFSTIAGGVKNVANVWGATIGGGEGDTVLGKWSTIGGGWRNIITGESSVVGGGWFNTADHAYCTIGGGRTNRITDSLSTIGGGRWNRCYAKYATIGGGDGNLIEAESGTISGGGASNHMDDRTSNIVTDIYGTIGGGGNNQAGDSAGTKEDAIYATVGGGLDNKASGNYASIPGGRQSIADGDYSFAAGRRAEANHAGTFVWADSTDASFASSGNNQFLVRASGGVGIGTTQPTHQLTISSANNSTVRLIGPDGSYGHGARLHFGDGSYVILEEDGDDSLHILATGRTAITGGNVGIGTLNPSSETKVHIEAPTDDFGVLVDAAGTAGSEIGLHTATSKYASLVKNAYWTAGAWRRFDVGSGAFLQEINPGGDALLRVAPAGTNPITWTIAMTIKSSGKVGFNTTGPTAALDVNGSTGYNQIRMRSSYTPTGTADPNGNVGDIAWNNSYIFIKTAAGWKRAALSTF